MRSKGYIVFFKKNTEFGYDYFFRTFIIWIVNVKIVNVLVHAATATAVIVN